MKRSLVVLVLAAFVSGEVLAQQPDTSEALPSVTLPPDLEQVLDDYEDAWEARDAGALAALFAPDGFVLRSGHPPVRGRDAIEEAYQYSGGPLHLRALAFEESGAIAYVIGAYASTPEWPDSGKFVLTLRRGPDGAWLITADMDNRNR